MTVLGRILISSVVMVLVLHASLCGELFHTGPNPSRSRFYFSHAYNADFNPLPDMPILGSSNSKANKDMMSKIWINGDTVI